jgi:amino acid transporter
MFLGRWGIHMDVALVLFTFGTLWSFTAVFASSWTANVPLPFLFQYTGQCNPYAPTFDAPCEHTYLIYAALFALIVIPLACLDVSEQMWLQATLTVLRFMAVILIIATCVHGMVTAPYMQAPPPTPHPPYIQPVTLAALSGFGTLFSTAVFAQLVHLGAPSIAQPLQDKTKVCASDAPSPRFCFVLLIGRS